MPMCLKYNAYNAIHNSCDVIVFMYVMYNMCRLLCNLCNAMHVRSRMKCI